MKENELHPLADGVHGWGVFSPAIDAMLDCYLVADDDEAVLVDPALPDEPEELLQAIDGVAQPDAIVVTTSGHWRAAAQAAERFGVPIFAPVGALERFALDEVTPFRDGQELPAGLVACEVNGGYPGECALLRPGVAGGQLFVADVVIHLPETGLALLPEEYGGRPELLRASLDRLLELDFTQLFFGHGPPLLERAKERLAALRG